MVALAVWLASTFCFFAWNNHNFNAFAQSTMSWTCHGRTNAEMVDALLGAGIITTKKVETAMKAVDRGLFVTNKAEAYRDSPSMIGYGATISAPHMHAYCLEILRDHLTPGAHVLDVGSGSGYLVAAFAKLVCNNTAGQVSGLAVGVDHIKELVDMSIGNVQRIPWAADLMKSGCLRLVEGDGRQGYSEGSPYDAIHVGAAAPQLPTALVSQLKPGGRLVVPVGAVDGVQELIVVDKKQDGSTSSQKMMGVMYVPLTSRQHQLQRA